MYRVAAEMFAASMSSSRKWMSASWSSHPVEYYTAHKRTQLRRTLHGAQRHVIKSKFMEMNTNKTATGCCVRRTVAKGERPWPSCVCKTLHSNLTIAPTTHNQAPSTGEWLCKLQHLKNNDPQRNLHPIPGACEQATLTGQTGTLQMCA